MRKLQLKVCGMSEPENLRAVAALKPDHLGFIFYVKSPRNAFGLEPGDLYKIDDNINKIGVFVDEDPDLMSSILDAYRIPTVQLHGLESPGICSKMKKKGYQVIKVFSGNDCPEQEEIDTYAPSVDFFLFDHRSPGIPGGSGRSFDIRSILQLKLSKPFYLGGGLDTQKVNHFMNRPPGGVVALDVNSRFEIRPGIKDISKLKTILS